MSKKLSILIGTYNRIDLLRACLDALIGNIKCEHEIIVIDAGSTDGTLQYVESLNKISLIRQGRLLGQAKSLNQAIRSLESDYLCWLSDDNVVQAGILDLAVKMLSRNSEIGMVALKVKDVTGPYVNTPYLGSIWPSGVLNCNQGVLPTPLMRKLGGFDELFRDYGIDADLTTRVLLLGYKVVYTKRIAILHYRDHETDNWIDDDGRRRHLEDAQVLYKRKYDSLMQPSISGGIPADSPGNGSGLLKFPYATIQTAGRKLLAGLAKNRFFPARWIGSMLRDLENARKGRFISKFDLLENLFKPFYLVQKIPEEITSKTA